ncbi:MAG: efflux RND transporter periplasmic adaptor subunit [Oscillatoria sp. PMC 1068.18]|nr:efflux RND transporter periplasmic adaptor subunit [Oscillatoria sp. PMC 1076.18]MEC4987615.1 efflux RND transporter periplasmic adaptor subunit [Oscillatoria sp. PMC 1068.18]
MYQPAKNCFRQDLVIAQNLKKGDTAKYFLIKEPVSGETVELGEEEYFLCQLMDGKQTPSQITSAFQEKFQMQLSLADFAEFSSSMSELGLFTTYQEKELIEPVLETAKDSPTVPQESNSNLEETLTVSSPATSTEPTLPEKKKKATYQLNFGSPHLLCQRLALISQPFAKLSWLTITGIIIACLTTVNNQFIFWLDLNSAGEKLPFLATIIFGLITVNFGSKLAQATVITFYGSRVEELGIQLTFGFFPLFYISKKGIKQLNRKQKLWTFATPLLFRLNLIICGILTWYCTRGTQITLATFSLILAQAACLGFLLDINPFWHSNGYGWLTNYFRLPRLFERTMRVWDMVLHRRPLPNNLSNKAKLGLTVYALVIVLSWGCFFLVFAVLLAITLEGNFQGTGVVLFGIIIALISRWYFSMTQQTNISNGGNNGKISANTVVTNQDGTITFKRNKFLYFWQKNWWKVAGLVGVAVLLSLPYEYRPGGAIALLPPKQKEIQADISGKVTEVTIKGADGEWIEAGTVLGTMEPSRQLNPATPVENDRVIIEEQIKTQEANLAKQKAQLDRLLATPRPEEVEVAQTAIQTAEEQLQAAKTKLNVVTKEVETAQKELETITTTTDFRSREAKRLQSLYQDGAIALQQYEDAEKLAATGKTEIEEKRNNVLVKLEQVEEQKQNIKTQEQNVAEKKAQLALVMSGTHPDEIAAAREDVEAAKAELKQKEQELTNVESQLESSNLVMPFDGRIITAYVDQKAGTYLEQGQTFAVAEDDRNIRGEIEVPETDVGEFAIGNMTEVKLSAYPNETLLGRVVSVEPTAIEKPNGRFIKVIIELPNTQRLLKSGMTGYAKIEGTTMPVIVAFTRPVVRFVQIEVWSWIP